MACERVVVLIDMDCFYVQVEQRRQPDLRGKPCAVVQYNKWKGGGIIAVSYEARAKGVKRNMRGDDAKDKCPDIILCMVPTANGKADLTRYRDAGAEVIQVLLQFSGVVERASIDEAYIDLTEVVNERMNKEINSSKRLPIPSLSDLEHTYVIGYPTSKERLEDGTLDEKSQGLSEYMEHSSANENGQRLLIAAALVEEIRLAVYKETSFRCSAGISHNKVLSKLACGINKPNKQTVLPMNSVPALFKQMKIEKIRNLGGKLGQQLMENYGIECIGQLVDTSKATLVKNHGTKTGEWLYEICRGIDWEPVKERHVAQSVGCSKTFRGVDALNTRSKVKHWVGCLTTELVERLLKDQEANNRTAKGLTAHICLQNHKPISRSCPINKYDVDEINRSIMSTLEQLNRTSDPQADVWSPAITVIGVSAGKFKSVSDMKAQSQLNLFQPKPEEKSRKTATNALESEHSDKITSHYFPKDSAPTCKSTNQSSGVTGVKPDWKEKESINQNESTNHSSGFADLKRDWREKSLNQNEVKKATDAITDKKRLFFNQHFGSVNKVNTDSSLTTKINESVVTDRANRQSPVKAPQPRKKSSFFEALRKSAPQEKPCKIDSAFDPSSSATTSNSEETSAERLKLKDISFAQAANQQPQTVSLNSNKEDAESTRITEGKPIESYNMDDVDMDVFNSLPLYLQQEIKFASRKKTDVSTDQSPQVSKRRKIVPSSGQTSIAGFFSNSSAVQTNKTTPLKKAPTKKGKPRKGASQLNCLEENAVPFGFFRARTQAFAAIRNAVEQHSLHSQKRKTDDQTKCDEFGANSS